MKKVVVTENWRSLIKFRDKQPIVYGIKLGNDFKKALYKVRQFEHDKNKDSELTELINKFGIWIDIRKVKSDDKVAQIIIYIPYDYNIDLEEIAKDLARFFTKSVPHDKNYIAKFMYYPNESLKECYICLDNSEYSVEILLDESENYDPIFDETDVDTEGLVVKIQLNSCYDELKWQRI